MASHILRPDASYSRRKVLCQDRRHRHKSHFEYFTKALCGAESLKDSGHVNVTNFNPGMKDDGCPACPSAITNQR